MTSGISSKVEHPALISQAKSYATYKKDLKMWLRITNKERKLQEECVVYSLDVHSSRIKEKIQDGLEISQIGCCYNINQK